MRTQDISRKKLYGFNNFNYLTIPLENIDKKILLKAHPV